MSAHAQPEIPVPPDDTGIGLAMSVVFAFAILTVTGAVALLALVGSWWMLGIAFAAHAGMAAIVRPPSAFTLR